VKFKFLAGLAFALSLTGTAMAQNVGVGTMSQGTMSYASGSAVAKLLAEKSGMQARVQPNSGESALIPMLASGELDFAIANVIETGEAAKGERVFKGRPAKHLQIASVSFPLKTALFVRADSDIKTIADLKGKRVTHGFTAMSSLTAVLDALLATDGLTADDIEQVMVPNVARGADELASGNVDAFFFAVGGGKVTEVDASVGGLRMLPMKSDEKAMAAMHKVFPYGYAYTQKPQPNLPGFTEPTATMAYDNLLITGKDVPEEIVYKTVKTIYENQPELANTFAPYRDFDVKLMYKENMPAPFHEGALRFYREVGLVK